MELLITLTIQSVLRLSTLCYKGGAGWQAPRVKAIHKIYFYLNSIKDFVAWKTRF